jgi:hypothetical protein
MHLIDRTLIMCRADAGPKVPGVHDDVHRGHVHGLLPQHRARRLPGILQLPRLDDVLLLPHPRRNTPTKNLTLIDPVLVMGRNNICDDRSV